MILNMIGDRGSSILQDNVIKQNIIDARRRTQNILQVTLHVIYLRRWCIILYDPTLLDTEKKNLIKNLKTK